MRAEFCQRVFREYQAPAASPESRHLHALGDGRDTVDAGLRIGFLCRHHDGLSGAIALRRSERVCQTLRADTAVGASPFFGPQMPEGRQDSASGNGPLFACRIGPMCQS